jgi:DNA-binding transcriptional LysR family regulator
MACAPDVPLQRLQAFLGLLYGRCLGIRAEVQHLPTAQQVDRLRDGRVDLGLLHDPGATPGVEAQRLYRGEALAAVVPRAHRLATRDRVRLEDLAGEVLLVVPRGAEPSLHDRAVALSGSGGAAFRELREPPGADVRDLLFAVASGHGVAVAPRSMLRGVCELGEAVAACSLDPRTSMPDTCLAWPASARPELRGVYAAAREVARELYGS